MKCLAACILGNCTTALKTLTIWTGLFLMLWNDGSFSKKILQTWPMSTQWIIRRHKPKRFFSQIIIIIFIKRKKSKLKYTENTEIKISVQNSYTS